MKTRQIFYPLATGLLFSGSFVAAKIVTSELGPLTLSLLRYIVALVFLSILAIRYEPSTLKIKRQDVAAMILLGIFGIVGYHYFFFLSLRHTSVANTAIINAFIPLITAFTAAVFIQEKLTKKNYWGITIAFGGVMLLLLKGNFENLVSLNINFGDSLMLLAVLSWTIYGILIKILLKTYSSFTLTFYATLFGVLILFFLASAENYLDHVYTISFSSLLAILYMGICASGLGYLFYNKSIHKIGPTKTASFIYSLVPALVAVLGWIIFDQPVSSIMLISILLIIFGLRLMLKHESV